MGLWVCRALSLLETAGLMICSEYEGILTHEIREKRKSHGLDKDREWDIWRDGCEGGESVISQLNSHPSTSLSNTALDHQAKSLPESTPSSPK